MAERNLKGKVVLVTGAGSGLGEATAQAFAQQGCSVVCVDVNEQAAQRTRDTVGASDVPSLAIGCDVADAAAVVAAVLQTVERLGRLDVVVNCAAIDHTLSVEDMSVDQWDQVIGVNLRGPFLFARAALPVMREQCSGYIVNIGSIGGMVGIPFQGLYSAAEFALIGLTEALRLEARSFGIHVTLIRTGDARTEFTAHRRHTQAAQNGSVYAGRFRTALSIQETDERNGIAPLKVARAAEKVISSRSPRGVYTVGPIFEVFAAYARPFVPARVFEWAVRKYYRLG